jgi:hypothetical protein
VDGGEGGETHWPFWHTWPSALQFVAENHKNTSEHISNNIISIFNSSNDIHISTYNCSYQLLLLCYYRGM